MPYAISPEARVNAYTDSRQSAVQTIALRDGGYITVWSGAGPGDLGYGVYLQRFNAAGGRVGDEVLVNATTVYSQRHPMITALASGGYAVTWDGSVPGGGAGDPAALGVFVQLFDAAGGRIGGETQVSGTGYSQQISALADGGYVVTWTQAVDYPWSGVSAQRFNALGQAQGPVFVLDQDRDATLASVTATDTGFIAVWRASNDDGGTVAVQAFDAAGVRVGETIRFPRDTSATTPDIVRLAEGGFAVVWAETTGLYAQILGRDGSPSGGRFIVQSAPSGSQLLHAVVATPDGGFTVAWEQFAGPSPSSIALSSFSATGERYGETVTIRTGINTPGEPPGLTVLASGEIVVSYARYVGDIANYYDVFQIRLTPQAGVITGTAAVDRLAGSQGADRLVGQGGDDTLFGLNGNDVLDGGAGNDVLNGGVGLDAALYAGVRLQYSASSTTVSGNGEGTDTLISIEEARFVDGVLTFDASSASAQVMRLYSATLNRTPDQAGLESNVAGLAQIGLLGLANIFVGSAEFQARFGALSNQQFVEQMYVFALGRQGDAAGIAGWVAVMDAGATRGQMVVSFSESAEHQARTAAVLNAGLWVPDAQAQMIARMYDATFDRLPDVGGLAGWTAALKAGTSLIEIAATFAGSAEFQARYGTVSNEQFVRQMYQFCLNREADAGGLAQWTNALNSGTSRAQMLLNFSESGEHVALTAASWLGGIRYAGYVGSPVIDEAGPKGLHDALVLTGMVEAEAYDPADLGLTLTAKDDDAFVLPGEPDDGVTPTILIDDGHRTVLAPDLLPPLSDDGAPAIVAPAHTVDDLGIVTHRDGLDWAWA